MIIPGKRIAEVSLLSGIKDTLWFKVVIILIIVIVMLLVMFSFSLLFTSGVFRKNTPEEFIRFRQYKDFFISKNDIGYSGYIRFETFPVNDSNNKYTNYPSIVKIVLQLKKGKEFTQGIAIELFDESHSIIGEHFLSVKDFRPVRNRYSQNWLIFPFYKKFKNDKVSYFMYHFVGNEVQR